MTTPNGYIETVASADALPIIIAAGEIAVISKLVPSSSAAKALIVLRSGERVFVATEYNALVERLRICVGDDQHKESKTKG